MTFDELSQYVDVAVTAAQRAGKIIRENLGHISKDDIGLKKESDFVTRVDTESERIIINTIKERFPGHSFLAEESTQESDTGSYRWIIDPLDGTTNYIHQYPVFSVSIALEYNGERIAGVIHDPLRNDLFTTLKGGGAFLNNNRIAVSPVTALKDSLISTGFPFRQKERIDFYLRLFKNIFNRVSDLRRAGSAALDLAYLACGRCEGFFELGLSPWDIAAGALMITEAGGIVTDFNGGNSYLSTGNIVAGAPEIHGELLKEVKKVFAGTIPE